MGVRGRASINLLPAFGNLIYLVFSRISYKYWGVIVIAISIYLVSFYGGNVSPILSANIFRFDSFSIPISLKTDHSPAAKNITDADLLEIEGLVNTPQGTLTFSKKLTVFSTSYDKNCHGCNSTTATGMKTGYGVVAVDPQVIALGTKLYIPGYGVAVAGDTGGNIKGNKIDLGFDDVKNGWWSSRFVEIYILK